MIRLALLTLIAALSFPALAQLTDDPEKVSPLLNGMMVPAINVDNSDGKSVSLNQLIANKPSLILFYRGGWCPFCNAQLAGLSQIEAELNKLGVQVLAIAPEAPATLKEGEGKGDYQLLSDLKLEATNGFGLGFTLSGDTNIAYKSKFGDQLLLSDEGKVILPVPAVYLVDTDGLVHFSYVNPNYRVRAQPELLLKAAELLVNK